MSIALSIIALSILIIVHEAGHMVVARWCGMRVERFSIFFGPVLARFRRGETTYQIAAVPLGGYVQIAGMNPAENLPPDDAGSFENKPVLARLATIFAGPATNYVFAMVLVFAALVVWGLPSGSVTTQIGSLADGADGAPARAGGLGPGDRIVRVAGQRVGDHQQIRKLVRESGGKPIAIEVEREGRLVTRTVTPKPRPGGGYQIGILFEQQWERIPLWRAALVSVTLPAAKVAEICQGLWDMIRGQVEAQIGGPVEIVRQLKGGFERGARDVLQMIVMLNILLFVFNLLPIPALDGGRLAFLAYTAVTRRRVNPRVEAAVHTVGMIILLGLFVIVAFYDLRRLAS